MVKQKSVWHCTSCGTKQVKWVGQCPGCEEWNTFQEELELKEKELSRLINIHEKMNFYQFINEFRIEKFKKLIQSPDSQKYSIMGLAKKAGFNSKSTFYTAFKSIEGTTPSQYQKEINKS